MGIIEKGLVSIIIPVFNRETLLPDTLDSILAQTYSQWECVIVDDGSTDSSFEVAHRYSSKDNRFKVYQRPRYKKKGANTCRNYGFTLSNGEFIQWFDSDDIMDFRMIEISVIAMQNQNIEMGVVTADYFEDNIYNIKARNDFSIVTMGENPAFEYFTLNFFFQTSQVIFNRSILKSLQFLFNENLNRNQETEFFIRLLLKNIKVTAISKSLVYIRSHEKSITSKFLNLDNSEKYIKNFNAYKQVYLNFKKSTYLTSDVRSHFSDHFLRSLRKARPSTFTYLHIFLFGNIHQLFPSIMQSIKIYIGRFI